MGIKISLADAAKKMTCTIDYLLALAETEEIAVFARIGPFSGTYRNRRGDPPVALDGRGRPLVMSGPQTTGGVTYTTLLAVEAGLSRAGHPITVRMVREEGAENGVRFAFSGDEEYFLYLAEPQTVTVEQLCVHDEDVAGRAVREAATNVAPTAALTKPIQRSAAQDRAILSEIQVLGLNPLALQPNRPGRPGSRGAVRESLKRSDPKGYGSIFSSEKVFATAWQRLRDAGDIRDAQPASVNPSRK